MKKTVTIIMFISLLLTGCNITTEEDNKPYTQGPTTAPENMKGPDSAPVNENPESLDAQAADIKRTHHSSTQTYSETGEIPEMTFTFNINGDKVKGLMHAPAFRKEETRTEYAKLTEQVLYKNINQIKVEPNENIPELSKAFIAALEEAVEKYRKANP